MTREEAIEAIKCNWPDSRYTILREALDMAVKALEDVTDKNVEKMTNADSIRAMTDEELLGFLMQVQDATINRFAKFELPNYNALADWLQQPAEEDTLNEQDCRH